MPSSVKSQSMAVKVAAMPRMEGQDKEKALMATAEAGTMKKSEKYAPRKLSAPAGEAKMPGLYKYPFMVSTIISKG